MGVPSVSPFRRPKGAARRRGFAPREVRGDGRHGALPHGFRGGAGSQAGPASCPGVSVWGGGFKWLWWSKPIWDPMLVGEFTTQNGTDFSGDWDVYWEYGVLTHGEIPAPSAQPRNGNEVPQPGALSHPFFGWEGSLQRRWSQVSCEGGFKQTTDKMIDGVCVCVCVCVCVSAEHCPVKVFDFEPSARPRNRNELGVVPGFEGSPFWFE